MYSAVPSTVCEAVIRLLATARAMPKSVTVSRSSPRSIRFDGLRSRCTMPRRCAASSASSAVASSPSARSALIGPPSASTSFSGRPSTSSITMKAARSPDSSSPSP
ncbi:hypothetical protein J2S46_001009 [Kitasatospora herbaricolor]|nr:hypothetical protein [Kitasatospora herbaricolor]MDQ0306453.1 hypothetical protein [Kitasatospora herbaricolor]